MTEVRTSSESNYAMPPCVRFSNPYVFWGRASLPEYPACEIPDTVVIPHTSEANKPRNGITQRLPVSYSPSSVLNLEQAADLEELKQLLLTDTPLARSVAPRLRMLRLIASRHEVIYTHPKAHWYKMKGWREVLECGHEHHVYQVEDLTAKRRNCPTCAKAAQLQNADELIQALQDVSGGVTRDEQAVLTVQAQQNGTGSMAGNESGPLTPPMKATSARPLSREKSA